MDVVKNKLIDITGNTYGKLTVLRRNGNLGKLTAWECECECGNIVTVRGTDLKSGNTKSCGCLKHYNPKHFTHNQTGTKLYWVYNNMKRRCFDKNNKSYNAYGARGITVCDEWVNNPTSFFEWALDNGYSEDASLSECSLDRIDVNGDYCPDNCRFSDIYTQANNKRDVIKYEYDGKSLSLAEWSRLVGIDRETLDVRINKLGWSIEKALTKKVRRREQ